MSSAAAKRSAIMKQNLARQRMRAARGLAIASSPKATPTKQSTAMSPPLEMRVKLLPRIVAEYRSKGWITAEEESDYHQLLSSKEFGDQVALQVEKALDLAKVKHESSSKKKTSATTNMRSLFRKSPSAKGSGGMTLQNKLSHRRKSRMGGQATTPTTPKHTNESATKETKPAIMDSKDLSIVEAMFGKEATKKDDAPTPADKRNERLERARQRRRSSFSPDPVQSKPKKELEKQESTKSKEEPLTAKQKSQLSTMAAQRLLKNAKSKSIMHQQPAKAPASQQVSLEGAPTVSLSQSESAKQQESADTGIQMVDHQPQRLEKTASSRSIYQRQPAKASEPQRGVSLGETPTISLSQSESTEQQEGSGADTTTINQILQKTASSRSIYQRKASAPQQVSLGEAPTISISQSESTEQQDVSDSGITASDQQPQRLQKTASSRSIYQQRVEASVPQQVLSGEAPTVSLSHSESTELRETAETRIQKIEHHQSPRDVQYVNNKALVCEALICEPRDLWKDDGVQSEETLKDLFVEMAFFARLGFVQPPSCLHCVYRESIEKMSPNLCCKQFVPWRKDANVPIHPHQLDGNIMLVQCHVARSLVQGEDDGVETYRWDKIRRLLVSQ